MLLFSDEHETVTDIYTIRRAHPFGCLGGYFLL